MELISPSGLSLRPTFAHLYVNHLKVGLTGQPMITGRLIFNSFLAVDIKYHSEDTDATNAHLPTPEY